MFMIHIRSKRVHVKGYKFGCVRVHMYIILACTHVYQKVNQKNVVVCVKLQAH